MHELAVTQNILEISLNAAQEQGAVRIRAIRLSIGPFCGIVPECIQIYLDVLAKGTAAEGAKIEATLLPLRVRCRDCGKESEISRTHIACPSCGSLRLERLSGREFTVESLEVD
ncbi:MAG TPA: hydrogenase maturation nickel metallochaperone HypA [Candidatus Caccousia avicola]|uniref:Hydrogenase maturation factor HypA n=1 Tax=Candidatus Caccousia avicola TaxID=2840721 RepID=A0A9D1DG08_9FIRM|nr:hydrogenase maturation nickel metallochaperone HypA [Candidatus Caccousia avicola]